MYEVYVDNLGCVDWACPDLQTARQYALKYTRDYGAEVVVFCDDDLVAEYNADDAGSLARMLGEE